MSRTYDATCPMTRDQIADTYFMEHRAKVIDIAAFLDRLDRAIDGASEDDNRVRALRDALAVLIDGKTHRARRVQELFSDPSDTPIDRAPGKGASGVYPSYPAENLTIGGEN